jgi:signal transduction histidine kinase/CheY-like chemotaxis protein
MTSPTQQPLESPDPKLLAARTQDTLLEWQGKVAHALLRVLSWGAVPALLYYTPQLIRQRAWILLVYGWSSLLPLLWLVLSDGATARRVRPWVTVGLMGLPSLLVLMTSGFTGVGAGYLLLSVVLATLLLRARVWVLMLVGAQALFAVCAWGFSQGWLPLVYWSASTRYDAAHWWGAAVFVVANTLMVVLSVQFLLKKLAASLVQAQALVETLRGEVAAREQAHEALLQAQAQMIQAQKMEVIGSVAAGLAHDMNNALTVTLCVGETLALIQDLDLRETRDSAAAIIDATQHAAQMTRQLLSFSRRDLSQPQVIDLRAVVKRLASALRRLIPSNIDVQMPTKGEALRVRVDINQLQQVIFNLGINARDAMAGGGKLTFQVQALDAQRVALIVTDTGTGMSQEVKERIFTPFFTTKAQGVGTGLGLAVVQALVEQMQGQLEVQSALGEGTTFTMTLPLTTEALTQRDEGGEDDAANDNASGDGYAALVVDDDVRVRALVSLMLSRAGYSVIDAPNGEAAVMLLESKGEAIDLLWTDVVMKQGAAPLLKWVQAHMPACAVVICTGYAEDALVRQGVKRGDWPLVFKPFTRVEALQACRGALQAKREERERAHEARDGAARGVKEG